MSSRLNHCHLEAHLRYPAMSLQKESRTTTYIMYSIGSHLCPCTVTFKVKGITVLPSYFASTVQNARAVYSVYSSTCRSLGT